MRAAKKVTKKSAVKRAGGSSVRAGAAKGAPSVASLLEALKKMSSKKTLEEMSSRYGVVTKKAFGVPVGKIQALSKSVGKDHALALSLWETGWYEARLLAVFVDEIDKVTPAQMDRWAKDCDNWGIVDTMCFKLFDQAPTALVFKKIAQWSRSREEFVKRSGVVLLACVALHREDVPEGSIRKCLPLLENAAEDERNFVMKGVSWALRSIGLKWPGLRAEVLEIAERLAGSENKAARWVGRDVLRDVGKKGSSPQRAQRTQRNSGIGD